MLCNKKIKNKISDGIDVTPSGSWVHCPYHYATESQVLRRPSESLQLCFTYACWIWLINLIRGMIIFKIKLVIFSWSVLCTVAYNVEFKSRQRWKITPVQSTNLRILLSTDKSCFEIHYYSDICTTNNHVSMSIIIDFQKPQGKLSLNAVICMVRSKYWLWIDSHL